MRIGELLRTELAATPGRLRDTLRLTLGAVLGVTILMGFHLPQGSWLLVALLVVPWSTQGAAPVTGFAATLGMAGGAALAIAVLAFATDFAWLLVPLVFTVLATCLFLARTTSIPSVPLLAGVGFAISVPEPGVDAATAVDDALWRMLAVTIGGGLVTVLERLAWPRAPEERLLDGLVSDLRAVEDCLDHALGEPVAMPELEGRAATGLGRHLDRLAAAEASERRLRRRHTEQIALVSAVDRMMGAAWRLSRSLPLRGGPAGPARLAQMRAVVRRYREALEARRTPDPVDLGPVPRELLDDHALVPLFPMMLEMRRALEALPPAMGFLGRPLAGPPSSPLDTLRVAPFFTSACRLSNLDAVRFGVKGALGATICLVIVHATDWPGIAIAAPTCLLVAQASIGAGLRKSILRAVGGATGGLLGMAVIVVAMPNLENLVQLLAVAAAGFFVATWIESGGPRTSYAGVQMAIALGMALVTGFGPETDLVTGRDRMLGILLGIAVMSTVDMALWPVYAAATLRRAFVAVLRGLAGLARVGMRGPQGTVLVEPSRVLRRETQSAFVTMMRLHDEAGVEPLDRSQDEERRLLLRLLGDAQQVYLALLELVRHRVAIDLSAVPAAVADPMRALAGGLGEVLDAVASRVEGREDVQDPALDALVAQAARAVESQQDALAVAAIDDLARAHVHARLALYQGVVAALRRLLADETAAAERLVARRGLDPTRALPASLVPPHPARG